MEDGIDFMFLSIPRPRDKKSEISVVSNTTQSCHGFMDADFFYSNGPWAVMVSGGSTYISNAPPPSRSSFLHFHAVFR